MSSVTRRAFAQTPKSRTARLRRRRRRAVRADGFQGHIDVHVVFRRFFTLEAAQSRRDAAQVHRGHDTARGACLRGRENHARGGSSGERERARVWIFASQARERRGSRADDLFALANRERCPRRLARERRLIDGSVRPIWCTSGKHAKCASFRAARAEERQRRRRRVVDASDAPAGFHRRFCFGDPVGVEAPFAATFASTHATANAPTSPTSASLTEMDSPHARNSACCFPEAAVENISARAKRWPSSSYFSFDEGATTRKAPRRLEKPRPRESRRPLACPRSARRAREPPRRESPRGVSPRVTSRRVATSVSSSSRRVSSATHISSNETSRSIAASPAEVPLDPR